MMIFGIVVLILPLFSPSFCCSAKSLKPLELLAPFGAEQSEQERLSQIVRAFISNCVCL